MKPARTKPLPRAFLPEEELLPDTSGRAKESLNQAHTKLLMVDFRSGEPVCQHPEVESFLNDGWHVQEAQPRVTNAGTKLLVVLTQLPPTGAPAYAS